MQALRAHAPADPLDAPGAADLTAHVDFDALAAAAALAAHAFATQGEFLTRLGIDAARRARWPRNLTGDGACNRICRHCAA